MKRLLTFICVYVIATAGGIPSHAVAALSEGTQFDILGPIQEFELLDGPKTVCPDNPIPLLVGARIKVNGLEVIVPCNSIITMPGSFLTPHDIFRGPQAGPSPSPQSGLAIADTAPAPIAPYEASIQGNIVCNGGCRYIAGLVSISQNSLSNAGGYIHEIDTSTGELHIGADPDATSTQPGDVRIMLNDPDGKYGLAMSADQRFATDPDNPAISAQTGYPMCVPNNGVAFCASGQNRPRVDAKPRTEFVMGPSPLPPPIPGNLPIVNCPAPTCDPAIMAAFEVGDFVTYAGILAKDAANQPYVSAYKLTAWLGIFTAPGTDPAYVNQEVSLMGASGPRFPQIDSEVQNRLKVEGFTTDPSRNVDVYAVDVDPTGGARTLRRLTTITPQAVPFGRFRQVLDKDPRFLPPPRELMVRVHHIGDPATGPDPGPGSGRYTAPIQEIIFPENTRWGDPLVPFNFHCLRFLLQGSGPLTTLGRTGGASDPIVTRLDPWPGKFSMPLSWPPAPGMCTP
ncbi:MAG: hypothetical protein CV088_18330 [Nitrospira sp. LK70]|nr:hypothetical protein [Nitrospira sp. LK70]